MAGAVRPGTGLLDCQEDADAHDEGHGKSRQHHPFPSQERHPGAARLCDRISADQFNSRELGSTGGSTAPAADGTD
jgi:hypothetical protein